MERSNLLVNKKVQLAAYAKDVKVMSRPPAGATETYSLLKNHVEHVGLEINTKETKIVTQSRRRRNIINLTAEDYVDISQNGRKEPEIKQNNNSQ